jgi:hypothetical protein
VYRLTTQQVKVHGLQFNSRQRCCQVKLGEYSQLQWLPQSDYATAVAADSPVIWWRFQDTATIASEENSGVGGSSLNATVTGSITGPYNATSNSSPTTNGVGVATIPSISGSTGTNAIQLANSSNINFPAFTVEGWVKLSAMPTSALGILNKGVDTAQNFMLAGRNANGALSMSLASGATGGTRIANFITSRIN